MAWTAKHLWSPLGGRRTLCGKTVDMPTSAPFTDDESKVTCRRCRKIIDAVNRAAKIMEGYLK